ncbi:hypothetical protein [Sphingomonas sp. SUN039]|uniref:hypothetical protein n=1 Tax=Sphingomonas sp. SUN039 TaxID=2937787 RepID=UPI002164B3B8|nr:hypothetical protein [Sphingomonas sp. SUN039]UVO54063.1 hypothetical protein M0209_07975 [Sphingomonas sp. SUN039]
MSFALFFATALAAGSTGMSKAVAEAQSKCVKAAEGPAPAPIAQLPVEKFDHCIVIEANKRPLKTRKAICALGKSGGTSGSTVEVYMANGKCRTDYE